MEAIELKETQEKLTAAEAKVAEFEAKEAAAAAEKAQKALTEEATVAITEALKDKELPDAAKARIMASLSKAPPVKDGKLDTEALLLKVVEVSTEEAAYVESITKAGTVQGMGGGSGEDDGKKKLREAVKRAHPTWPDAQVDIYVNGR